MPKKTLEDPNVILRVIAVRVLFDGNEFGSKEDFARRIRIGATGWRNFETGFAPVSKKVLLILHRRFGISVDWVLFGLTGNMPKKLLRQLEKHIPKS